MNRIGEVYLEDAIELALTQPLGAAVAETPAPYGDYAPGGFQKRKSADYDRELSLLPNDVIDFITATQPKEWLRLKQHHGDDVRQRFLRRLRRQIDSRGTLEVLRQGIKDSGIKFHLGYFRPHSGLNQELRRMYEANLFSVVRQLRYGESAATLDIAIFLNGLPIFTAELKNQFNGQTVEDAVKQYRTDRDPRESLFAFGRCLAHFAVDPDSVLVTTRLNGEKTRFLPFNKGYNDGAGNPPQPKTKGGYKTAYLWEEVWAKDSILNLIQHFIFRVQKDEEATSRNGAQIQLFPRYHQMDAVRRLVADARENGPGQQYLVQHSAGSGKSFTIAWLAHWLSVLHDDNDERVFDSIVVITDRRVLDQQLQESIRQFEQTLGVVENIDTTSKQLKHALEEGKTIIVTTLQKFPYIVRDIGELPGSQFAIIVDEAHSSQSGEQAKHLKQVLRTDSLEDAADQESAESDDLEDRIVAEMKSRGRLPNASMFAFTATPKPKTLELFGTPGTNGKPQAFSLYSMRQAIEEGFILDVLANYTTYTTYWKLLKKVEDDPQYDSAKAQRLLRSFVDLHEHSVRKKVEIMAEHFHQHVRHRIGGRAKAMIVTRSRLHCVRYKLALDEYLQEQGHPYRSLVAFSGTVKDKGAELTESGMNKGIPESQTAATFERPEYRFLVVANKFQTGFDQPLLHTMYVDKKLGGVNAVQTLSRLNRTHPDKDGTMVLDFANEADEIQKSFEPYYEATLLSETTDPNLLYDRQHELMDFGIFTQGEVDEFAELYFGSTLDQADLYAALDPIAERARQRETEELQEFRSALRDYARLYAFLSQVLTFADSDLEKLYVFARLLRRYLRPAREDLPREIQEQINMDALRIAETYSGPIEVDRGNREVDPAGGRSGHTPVEQLEALSVIIRELNQRFGTDLGPGDRVALESVQSKLRGDESLRLSVKVNPPENARLAFKTKFHDFFQGLIDSNFALYKRAVDDNAFGDHLVDEMFDAYVDWLGNGEFGPDDLLEEIRGGESTKVEFKSTLRRNMHTGDTDDRLVHSCLKTIAGFQNAAGGVLLIGVEDEGEITGIEKDAFANNDKFLRYLNSQVKSSMGQAVAARIKPTLWEIGGQTVCRVECPKSPEPVWLRVGNTESFYVRTGPATEEMTPSQMHAYVAERFGQ